MLSTAEMSLTDLDHLSYLNGGPGATIMILINYWLLNMLFSCFALVVLLILGNINMFNTQYQQKRSIQAKLGRASISGITNTSKEIHYS